MGNRTIKSFIIWRLNTITKGKYPRTNITKQKIRLARLGTHLSDKTKLKISQKRKGKKNTEETRAKISQANIGRHHTEETKIKMSKSQMGNKNGLGKHLPPRTDEHKKKLSLAAIGKKPSLETRRKMGLSHLGKPRLDLIGKHPSEETRKKMGEKHRGKKHSEEAKRKISLALMGNKSRTGEHLSPENVKQLHLALLKKKPYSKQNISKPQKELFCLLKQIFSDAQLEYPIKTSKTCRFADIGVPSLKIAFEYDGTYWHEKRKIEDSQRDKELAEVGWVTFRINNESLKILSKQKIFTLFKMEPKQ